MLRSNHKIPFNYYSNHKVHENGIRIRVHLPIMAWNFTETRDPQSYSQWSSLIEAPSAWRRIQIWGFRYLDKDLGTGRFRLATFRTVLQWCVSSASIRRFWICLSHNEQSWFYVYSPLFWTFVKFIHIRGIRWTGALKIYYKLSTYS